MRGDGVSHAPSLGVTPPPTGTCGKGLCVVCGCGYGFVCECAGVGRGCVCKCAGVGRGHSSILAWRIPSIEEPSRLQSMVLQRVGHD